MLFVVGGGAWERWEARASESLPSFHQELVYCLCSLPYDSYPLNVSYD